MNKKIHTRVSYIYKHIYKYIFQIPSANSQGRKIYDDKWNMFLLDIVQHFHHKSKYLLPDECVEMCQINDSIGNVYNYFNINQ